AAHVELPVRAHRRGRGPVRGRGLADRARDGTLAGLAPAADAGRGGVRAPVPGDAPSQRRRRRVPPRRLLARDRRTRRVCATPAVWPGPPLPRARPEIPISLRDLGGTPVSDTVMIVNAAKADARAAAELHERVARAFAEKGRPKPRLVMTTPEDNGATAAGSAVESGAELVVACGGDGTV